MTRPHGHPLGSVAATLALSDWERRTALAAPDYDPDEMEDDDPGADLPEPRTDGGTMSDRLSEIEQRLAGATPGVWKLWGMDVLADQDGTSDVDTAVPVATTHMLIDGKPRTFDAELIAHAPTDLAALVKFAREVEALHPREDHRDSHGKRYAICGRCLNFRGEYVDWPCATAKAIQRLGGAE